jgi:hypothetical protein
MCSHIPADHTISVAKTSAGFSCLHPANEPAKTISVAITNYKKLQMTTASVIGPRSGRGFRDYERHRLKPHLAIDLADSVGRAYRCLSYEI